MSAGSTESSGSAETRCLTIPAQEPPGRLDRVLAELDELGLTRSQIHRLIADGKVTVDGALVAKKLKVKGGETVTVIMPKPVSSEILPQDIPLSILYEDEHLVVVDKPAGMVTHPATGNFRGTLVNALLHRYGVLSTLGGGERPGIVHRLDKDTSGLLVVARTDEAYHGLRDAIEKREIARTYLALICGHIADESGSVDKPIGRSIRDRRKMAVTNIKSRDAVTEYVLRERYRTYDLLEVHLQTGRTHQIRVHFAHLGHPVLGDRDYGGREKWHGGIFGPERPLGRKLLALLDHQALHACKLEFAHPITEEPVCVESNPPADFQAALDLLLAEGS